MVPATAAPPEATSATAVTKALPRRAPNNPFRRKPARGRAGISQSVFSIFGVDGWQLAVGSRLFGQLPTANCQLLLTSRDARRSPHGALTFLSSPVLIIVGRGRIELPSLLVPFSFLLSDLQFFVVGVADSDGAGEFLYVVLLGRGDASRRCFIPLRLGHVPLRVDVAAGQRRIDAGVLAQPVSQLLRSGGHIRHRRLDAVIDPVAVPVAPFVFSPVNELFGLVHLQLLAG